LPEIIQIALYLIGIVVLAYVGFMIVEKIKFPAPGDLIARIVVGGLALWGLYKVMERLL
jgi:putative effector of murein hydrolase LrgA (UPF0299 family)